MVWFRKAKEGTQINKGAEAAKRVQWLVRNKETAERVCAYSSGRQEGMEGNHVEDHKRYNGLYSVAGGSVWFGPVLMLFCGTKTETIGLVPQNREPKPKPPVSVLGGLVLVKTRFQSVPPIP